MNKVIQIKYIQNFILFKLDTIVYHWYLQKGLAMKSKMNKIEMRNYSNYKFKVCAYCKNEMILSKDDILFDKSWYHKECWPLTQT